MSELPGVMVGRQAAVPTPLPRTTVASLLLVILGTAFNLNVLFPFVAWMVADFLPDRDFTNSDGEFDKVAKQAAVASKSGWLAAQFMLGQFISAYVWAWLADHYGRRPVLLVSTIFVAGASLMFGFSVNYPMAIASRLLTGLLNGSMGVSKTYMAEICDASNQAKGFSLLGITWAMGAIIGPLMGGFMSRRGIVPGFPYAPPLIGNAIVCIAGFIFALRCLPESRRLQTLGEPAADSEERGARFDDISGGNEGDDDDDVPLLQIQSPQFHQQHKRLVEAEEKEDSRESSEDSDENETCAGDGQSAPLLSVGHRRNARGARTHSGDSPFTNSEKYEEEQNRVHRPHQHIQRAHPLGSLGRWYRTSKLRRILHTTNIMLAIALYGAIGFVWIIYDETFPIWARLSNTEGGLNFEPNDVGLAVAISGVIMMVVQILVYPRVERRYGALHAFRIGAMLGIVLFFTIPLINKLAPERTASQFDDDLQGLIESGGLEFRLGGNSSFKAGRESFAVEGVCTLSALCAENSSESSGLMSSTTTTTTTASRLVFCTTHMASAPPASPFLQTQHCRQATFRLDRAAPLTLDAAAGVLSTLSKSLHCAPSRLVGVVLTANATVSVAVTEISQSRDHKIQFWLLVSAVVGLRSTSNLLQLTSSFIITSNVALPSLMAAVNGLGQAVNSLLRSFGPAVAGNALGWSLSNHTYPIDYHFVFFIAAIAQMVALGISMRMSGIVNIRVVDTLRVQHEQLQERPQQSLRGQLDASQIQREEEEEVGGV